MRPTQATALVPYLCIAPVSGEVGRAGVGHRTRNTLDAGYCLAALTWFRVTLCEICKKAAVRSPRRPCWHGRWWGRRGHGWNRERLKGAIFVVTAVRYSLGWAATAAVLTVMATRLLQQGLCCHHGPDTYYVKLTYYVNITYLHIRHFTRVVAALARVLVACVLTLIVMLQWGYRTDFLMERALLRTV
jgi:hypothetical protein